MSKKIRLTVKVSLVFIIYIYTNTRKTFYGTTNEPKCLLASLTTIPESLHPIRNPINTRPIS